MKQRSRLYPLLPAWYRGQDAAAGLDESGRAPVQAWLASVEQMFEAQHAATGAAYDNWFVETCAPELLPALGVLVGLELDGPTLPGDRRLVANATQRWRRRGSTWALKEALTAASGWHVDVHEFEDDLVTTENPSHHRATRARSRRRTPALGAQPGPNLRRVQVYVRRDFEVIVEDADPAPLGAGWYGFDAGALACSVPENDGRVRVHVDGRHLQLHRPDSETHAAWESDPAHVPDHGHALLDARRGRFWLPSAQRGQVRVDWVSRRPGPIGAGLPGASLTPPEAAHRAVVSRSFLDAELGPGRYRGLDEAVAAWPGGVDLDIRVLDSGLYAALDVALEPGRTLTLHAHPGELPCIEGVTLTEGALRLGGILVAGDVSVRGSAELCAATVRGRLALEAGRASRCLLGPIEVTRAGELVLEDSVIGASPVLQTPGEASGQYRCQPPSADPDPHGLALSGPDVVGIALRAARCTFLGGVRVGDVRHARDCLFRGPLSIARPHVGRIESCPHPRGSRVAEDAQRHAFEPEHGPELESVDPASPRYACLVGPPELLEAASDGGEPGALHGLHARARRRRLEQQLERFLPAGFEACVEMVDEHG